jgi:hypothetical protein
VIWRSPAADPLKTPLCNLGKNGLVSVKAALNSVISNAKRFASDAKSAFALRSTAVRHSLSSLDTEINSAQGQPPLTGGSEVVSSVTICLASEGLYVESKLPWLPADGLVHP